MADASKHAQAALGVRADLFSLEALRGGRLGCSSSGSKRGAAAAGDDDAVDGACSMLVRQASDRNESLGEQLQKSAEVQTLLEEERREADEARKLSIAFEKALVDFFEDQEENREIAMCNALEAAEALATEAGAEDEDEEGDEDEELDQVEVGGQQTQVYSDSNAVLTHHALPSATLVDHTGMTRFFDPSALKRALIVEAKLHKDHRFSKSLSSVERLISDSELFMLSRTPRIGAETSGGRDALLLTRILSPTDLTDVIAQWVDRRPQRVFAKVRQALDAMIPSLEESSAKPRAAALHKLWELALHDANHPAFLAPESQPVLKYLLNTIAAQAPVLDAEAAVSSRRPSVQTAAPHFLASGALAALVACPPTRDALLHSSWCASVVVESVLVSLKRVPLRTLLEPRLDTTVSFLLGALANLARSPASHAAILRSRALYADLLLKVVQDASSPWVRLRAVQVLCAAFLSAPDLHELGHKHWERFVGAVLEPTFTDCFAGKKGHAAGVHRLRHAQLHVCISVFHFVRAHGGDLAALEALSGLELLLGRLIVHVARLKNAFKGLFARVDALREAVAEAEEDTQSSYVSEPDGEPEGELRESEEQQQASADLAHTESTCELLVLDAAFATAASCMLLLARCRHVEGGLGATLAAQACDALSSIVIASGKANARAKAGKLQDREQLATLDIAEQLALVTMSRLCDEDEAFKTALGKRASSLFSVLGVKTLPRRGSQDARRAQGRIIYCLAYHIAIFPAAERQELVRMAVLSDADGDPVLRRYLAAALCASCKSWTDFSTYFELVKTKYHDAEGGKDKIVTCFLLHGLWLVSTNQSRSPLGSAGVDSDTFAHLLDMLVANAKHRHSVVGLLKTMQVLLDKALQDIHHHHTTASGLTPSENLDRCVRVSVQLLAYADPAVVGESLRLLWVLAAREEASLLCPLLLEPSTIRVVFDLCKRAESSIPSAVTDLTADLLLALADLSSDAVVLAIAPPQEPPVPAANDVAMDGAADATAAEGDVQEKPDHPSDLHFVNMVLELLQGKSRRLATAGAFLFCCRRVSGVAAQDAFRDGKGLHALVKLARQSHDSQARAVAVLALVQATETDRANQKRLGCRGVLNTLGDILRNGSDQDRLLVGSLISNLLLHTNNRSAIYKLELTLQLDGFAAVSGDNSAVGAAAATVAVAAAVADAVDADPASRGDGNGLPELRIRKRMDIKRSYESWLAQVEMEQHAGQHHLLFKGGKKGLLRLIGEDESDVPLPPVTRHKQLLHKELLLATQKRLRQPISNMWSPRSPSVANASPRSPPCSPPCSPPQRRLPRALQLPPYGVQPVETHWRADSGQLSSPNPWSPRSPKFERIEGTKAARLGLDVEAALRVTVDQNPFLFPERLSLVQIVERQLKQAKQRRIKEEQAALAEDAASDKAASGTSGSLAAGGAVAATTAAATGAAAAARAGPEAARNPHGNQTPELSPADLKHQLKESLRESVKERMRRDFKQLPGESANSGRESPIRKAQNSQSAAEDASFDQGDERRRLAMFKHVKGGRVYQDLPTYELPSGEKTYLYYAGARVSIDEARRALTRPPQLTGQSPLQDIPSPPHQNGLLEQSLQRLESLPVDKFLDGPRPEAPPEYSFRRWRWGHLTGVTWTENGVVIDEPLPLLLSLPEDAADGGLSRRSTVFGSRFWRQDSISLGSMQDFGALEVSDLQSSNTSFELRSSVFFSSSSKTLEGGHQGTSLSCAGTGAIVAGVGDDGGAGKPSARRSVAFEANMSVMRDKAQFEKLLLRDEARQPGTASRVETLLSERFEFLFNLFRFYSIALGSVDTSFTMQLNEYGSLLKDCGIVKHRGGANNEGLFVDGVHVQTLESTTERVMVHQLDSAVSDTIFIIVNKTLPEQRLGELKALVAGSRFFHFKHNESLQMHEFMEAIVRVADASVCQPLKNKNKEEEETMPPLDYAVEAILLVLEHVFEDEEILECANFRRERMFNWAVNAVLKENVKLFRSLFKRYSSMDTNLSKSHGSVPGEQLGMSDWLAMVSDFGVINLHFNRRDAAWLFATCTDMHVHPFKNWRELVSLNFGQFLESIARLADSIFVPTEKQLEAVHVPRDSGEGGFDAAGATKSGIVAFYHVMQQTKLWASFPRPYYSTNASRLQLWLTQGPAHGGGGGNGGSNGGGNGGGGPATSSHRSLRSRRDVTNVDDGLDCGFYDERALDFKILQLIKLVLVAETRRAEKSKELKKVAAYSKAADTNETSVYKSLLNYQAVMSGLQTIGANTAPNKGTSDGSGLHDSMRKRAAVHLVAQNYKRRLTLDITVAKQLVGSSSNGKGQDTFAELSPARRRNLLLMSHYACELVRQEAATFDDASDQRLGTVLNSPEFLKRACLQLLSQVRGNPGMDNETQRKLFKALSPGEQKTFLNVMRKAVRFFQQFGATSASPDAGGAEDGDTQ